MSLASDLSLNTAVVLMCVVLVLGLWVRGAAADAGELPAGGAGVLSGDWLAVVELATTEDEAEPLVSMERVKAEGVPFDEAVQVTVTQRPRATWSIQLNAYNGRPIRKGDVIHVRFWARCLDSMTGEGFADVKLELSRDPWPQSLHRQVSYRGQWQQFDLPFRAERDYAPDDAKLSFQLGYDAQVMQLAGVQILNYGPDRDLATLPATRITYAGHEPDAPWREAAATRIDRLRKGDLTVRVVDADGKPLPNAEVKIEMTRHAFRFGTAVVAELLAHPEQYPRYARFVEEYCNEVVFENDLKWPKWEGVGDPEHIDAALDWLERRGITTRGHVLVWPGWSNMPADVRDLEAHPQALRQRVRDRVTDTVTAYRGRIADWDVLNEPFNNHDLMDIFGDEVMVEWFQLARQADPSTQLYINDWGIVTGGGRDSNHQDHYFRTIQYLIERGAPIDGIGVQGHFGTTLTPPDRLIEIVDRFAAFGKKIKVTELDIVMDDEQMRADYLRDFVTVMFSHEAVEGVLVWGFWANRHWKPEAAFYTADWRLRPHGEAWLDLIKNQWWTRATRTSDADGSVTLRGFCGDYDVTASLAGRTSSGQVSLSRDGAAVELILD